MRQGGCIILNPHVVETPQIPKLTRIGSRMLELKVIWGPCNHMIRVNHCITEGSPIKVCLNIPSDLFFYKVFRIPSRQYRSECRYLVLWLIRSEQTTEQNFSPFHDGSSSEIGFTTILLSRTDLWAQIRELESLNPAIAAQATSLAVSGLAITRIDSMANCE